MFRSYPPNDPRLARSGPALRLFGGALLAAGIGVAAVVPSNTGCAPQKTSPAPDAALPPCEPGPFVFCEPVTGDAPSCDTDEGTSRWLTRLPRTTRYPVGCVVDYVGARDEQGDCELEAVCKCVVEERSSSGPAADGGDSDAGTDASAPTPSSDAGATVAVPAWRCYP